VVRLTHDDDADRVREIGASGVPSVQSVQLRMQRSDGTMVWTEHRVVPLRDAAGEVTAVAGIARDVTALKVKEAYLSHRALHDPLTGLPNRVLLLDRLEAALARIRRHKAFLAVLYLDLDRFKTVNDNLGHEAGDRLLQVVGRKLQETLRPSDSVARLGGDEFAAVLPDLHDPVEALHVAERLLSAIAEPVDVGHGTLVTTVSIGIAGASEGGVSAGELLRRADFAMYKAKDRGRARVVRYDALGGSEALDR
jgi:diguanylate cyclase (GGDEF)-like protein